MTRFFTTKSFLFSTLLTFIYFSTGLLFFNIGWDDLGSWLFIGLPFLLGVAVGFMEHRGYGTLGVLTGTLVVVGALCIVGGASLMCVMMVLPIMAIGVGLGLLVAFLIRKHLEIKKKQRLKIYLLPLVLYLFSSPVTKFLFEDNMSIAEVRTEEVFPFASDQVFDAIKSVDTLIAEKPFLMKFDLPIPVKCILEKEEVGGIRTCYFDPGQFSKGDFGSGTITERITELERPTSISGYGVLRMDVIDYELIGREWLGFKEAIYYFNMVEGNNCKLTRVTTYTSTLTPRFYWEPLEKLGIGQEHEYVFRNLKNDLARMNGR